MTWRSVWIGVLCAVCVATTAFADDEPLDLVSFARVTATAVKDTFLGLWPRETDDAAYTVRDGDPDTAWKIPTGGPHDLIVDFAPFATRPPALALVSADWTRKPKGAVKVRVHEACGGPVLFEAAWKKPLQALILDPPVEGRCLVVSVKKPGKAALVELRAYSYRPDDVAPALLHVSGEPLDDGWRIFYEPTSDAVHHVRISALAGDVAIPIVDAPPLGPFDIPRPLGIDMDVLVEPISDTGAVGEGTVVHVLPKPAVVFEGSGLVEGFYGRPWSHEERRRLLLLLGRTDMGVYIYGPKDDPLHRDEWRTPYPDDAIARFGELNELGALFGVAFSFGISPGKDMDLEDEGERATLLDKLSPFVDAGVRHFSLLFDDIEFDVSAPIDGDLGARHADLCNWLLSELTTLAGGDVTLWMVPTVYSDLHKDSNPEGPAYLDAMAALDPSIGLMWTGTGVFSQDLGAADLVDVTARTGRMPIIWDNEYATDGGDGFVGKIYTAPYLGRRPDLVDAVGGLVQNLSITGSTNRLVLGSVAAFLSDPSLVDPDAAQRETMRLEGAMPAEREMAWELASTFYGNGALGLPGVNLPSNRAMNSAVEEMMDALKSGEWEAVHSRAVGLMDVAAAMLTTQSRMHHSGLHPTLVDDFWYPTNRLTYEGRALLLMMSWLGDRFAGADDLDARRAVSEQLFLAIGERQQLSLFVTESFWDFLQGRDLEPRDFAAPTIREPEVAPAVGVPWNYKPVEDGATWAVYGLDGAFVENGALRWTPPHAGNYAAVVIASDSNGWNWHAFDLYVAPEPPPADGDDEDDVDDDPVPDHVVKDEDDEDDDGCGCG